MKRFLDGTDQVNSKKQRAEKGQIKKIQKNKKERMEERKIRDYFSFNFLTYVEVPILVVCSPSFGNALGLD
jgi:hypothetical protein